MGCETGLRAERQAQQVRNEAATRTEAGAVWIEATKKDPVVGSTGPSNQFNVDDRSGRLRCSLLGNALCLRAFLSLNDFEFNVIALLEALVSLRLDGTVVDEHIGPIIPADKAEALCVIEPFHFTFDSRHVPYSGLSLRARSILVPRTSFSSLGFATLFGKGRKHRRLTFSRHIRLIPVLWLCAYSALIAG